MSSQSRRRFLASAACAAAALPLRTQSASLPVLFDLASATDGPRMPDDFLGLSYEVQQLADPAFFSPANTGLVRAFRQLSPSGVLRLGGNTSEFAYWKPTPGSPEPAHPHTREVEGEPKAHYYAVTPQAIENLAAFLRATGWSCLYGIGMGTNTPERAADEAVFVDRALGSSLQYFQIGNEVDLFDRHLRDPKTWSPRAYLDEWLTLARAVSARLPQARFGIPDVAGNIDWLPAIAAAWPSIPTPPHVTTLSHHHYFGGPAENPEVNIPNLLRPETSLKVQQIATKARAAARQMGVRLRMTEGNTCYRGGKPGLSDVFAAALWSANYALLLASNGYSGINLHGGAGPSVANSVGGFLPGDRMLRAQGRSEAEIASHPHPFYTPIGAFGSEYRLQPVACGMQFACLFAGATLLQADLAARLRSAGANASAFAARLAGGKLSLIVLNKDADRDLALTLRFGPTRSTAARLETLTAPALDSRLATFASVPQPLRLHRGQAELTVPRASALRLTLL